MVDMLTFALSKLLVAGAVGACIAGSDGRVLGEAGAADWEKAAPLIPAAAASWNCLAGDLGSEGFTGALIEADSGVLIVMPLPGDDVLAVLLKPGANPGRVRYEMKKNLELIASVI